LATVVSQSGPRENRKYFEGDMRLLTALLCLCLLIIFGPTGCGSVSTQPMAIVVNITNPFPNNSIQVGTPAVTLNATVANDPGKKGVKWQLTQAGVACEPDCGRLVPSSNPSFYAVYTPPTTTPLNQQATIAAVAVDEGTQEFAFTFTLIPPASVQITNKFTSIYTGASPVTVNATVMNDPAAAGVTWTLTAGGSNCSPACGTLAPAATPSFSAVYTPPTTVPSGSGANPTITATSVTNPAANDSFSFAINPSSALFKGSYAFLLRGYYLQTNSGLPGVPMSFAGTVTADGNGNLTNGELDLNNGGGITYIPSPQTGTYTVTFTPTGIAQVAMEISSFTFPNSNPPIDLKFRATLSGDGTHGRLIEFDGSSFINAGTIELQDSTAISTKPSGSFAFGVNSDSPWAGRTVAAGQLVLGAGGVTGGLIDQSVNGAASPTFVGTAISADAESAPDSLGRGTLTITVQGQSVNYAYYIIDSSHFEMIEIDHGQVFGTVFAGFAQVQNALTASSVNGINVIQLTGFDQPSANDIVPVSIVGLFTVSGGNAYTLKFDINNVGNSLTQHGANGSVTFDPTTGRAVVSAPDGFNNSFVNQAAWYLYDQNKGFFVEEDISTPNGTPLNQAITNLALSGTTLAQTGAPYTAASLSGNTIAGFGASSSPLIPNLDLGFNFNNTANPATYTANGDLTSVLTQASNLPSIQFNGKYQLALLSEGYGRILLPTALFGDFTSPTGTQGEASFYMIAPNQFVGIGIVNNLPSGVFFVDPQ
jgi:hypothetical protein